MSKQPEAAKDKALKLADVSDSIADEQELIHLISWVQIRNTFRANADELRRLHALNVELLEALRNLDEAYCRAGSPMTRECRTEDRKRLIAARAAIAKAEAA